MYTNLSSTTDRKSHAQNWWKSSTNRISSTFWIEKVEDVASIFQRKGHTVSKWGFSPDSHVVVMCTCRLFAQKRLTKGGSQVPQDPPSYTPEEVTHTLLIKKQTTGEKINAYSQVIAWNKQLIEYKAVYVPKIHV